MRFETPDGALDVDVTALVVAGWTGRDTQAVQHHIDELAALGVAPPSTVPLFYRVASALLTQAEEIEVLGTETSGEVEPFVLRARGKLWLGLASDHTDRQLETVSVASSKQICAKPVARKLWALEALSDRLDNLVLRCQIDEEGRWVDYQHGNLAAIRPLCELLAATPLAEGEAMLCGTLAAMGGVRPARKYRMRLEDTTRGERLELSYQVRCLPAVS
jgi:hypothetical protein